MVYQLSSGYLVFLNVTRYNKLHTSYIHNLISTIHTRSLLIFDIILLFVGLLECVELSYTSLLVPLACWKSLLLRNWIVLMGFQFKDLDRFRLSYVSWVNCAICCFRDITNQSSELDLLLISGESSTLTTRGTSAKLELPENCPNCLLRYLSFGILYRVLIVFLSASSRLASQ